MKVLDLKGFRAANKIQQSELADFLAVTTSFVSQVENAKRDLPETQLSKILLNHLGWDTSMLWKEVDDSAPEESIEIAASRQVKLIPLLPFSAAAGYLVGGNGADAFREEAVAFSDFTDRGADCAIRVDGDSMYPRYKSGDVLAIKIIKDPKFFQWGRTYCISTTQGCIIKKLFPDPTDENKIICHSENTSAYPDYKITMDDVLAVAIVVGHAGVE